MRKSQSYAERLSAAQDNWKAAQNQAATMFGGLKVPAGTYEAQLQSATLTESKNSGKLMVKREHVIVDGEQKGSVIYDYMRVEGRDSDVEDQQRCLSFLHRWIDQMGFTPPDDLSEVPAVIEAINDAAPRVLIDVLHDGDYQNVRVKQLLDPASEGGETETEAPAADGEAEAAVEESPDLQPLKDFATANEIAFEPDATREDMVGLIGKKKIKRSVLLPGEIELLGRNGLEKNIIAEPKPVARSAARPVAKRPVPKRR